MEKASDLTNKFVVRGLLYLKKVFQSRFAIVFLIGSLISNFVLKTAERCKACCGNCNKSKQAIAYHFIINLRLKGNGEIRDLRLRPLYNCNPIIYNLIVSLALCSL